MKKKTCLTWISAGSCLLIAGVLSSALKSEPEQKPHPLELTRPAHSWEFLCAVGQKSAVFGDETGKAEAWVYPLKLLRDFSLVFHTDGHELPAASLVRAITARPESTSLLYVGDTFRVMETFVAPVHEAGVIMRLDVETESPLEIEAVFRRDFALEWPAGLGATYENWDEAKRAFVFGEEHKTYAVLVGSPTATLSREENQSNYVTNFMSGFRLGTTRKGKESKLVVMAASTNGAVEAEATYRKLTEEHAALEQESAHYYEDYLQRTVSLELPDEEVQRAYDWSRISVLQGLVTNPTMGTGLIAGYRTSGESQRPGFAWFFGRDALWTSFALNSAGDFATTKTALEFLTQFQREDGRIPHEIAQTAYLVDWFKHYPFGFASADATPLYIIAVEDYVRWSGDVAFAREHWDNAKRAYEFLRSTYGPMGLPKNVGVGHGWIEGGPLLPVQSELYQSGLGAEAIRSLGELARLTGHDGEAKALSEEFAAQKAKINETFWSEDKHFYAFAVNQENKIVPEATVLATVPMWFGVLDGTRSKKTIGELATLSHSTDWGMRIISDESTVYSAGGYHYGSVWPLFTGWAAVGEYNYHEVHPAWQNVRANAMLALDGSPGHVTEVLSGTYYQGLSTSSPHQVWSAAMVVSPLLRGLFGLKADAIAHTLTLAPSLPANWNSFAMKNVRVGKATADMKFRRTGEEMVLEVRRTGESELAIEFQPAMSLRAEVVSVSLNGRPLPFKMQANESDQHLRVRFSVYGGPYTLRVQMRHDFAVSYTPRLPWPGSRSQGLRILSESWSSGRDLLTLSLEGVPGKAYELSLFQGKELTGVEGGTLWRRGETAEGVQVVMPAGSEGSVRSTLTFRFAPRSTKGNL